MTLASTTMDSPVGTLTLVASDAGLRAVLWPTDEDHNRVPFNDEVAEDADHPVLVAATDQLNEYFAGTRQDFDLPLDPQGTDFQRQVWDALAKIPYGETVSYGQQADAIGNPKAVRAVGGANGKNPLSIVLPCHRVVGANGSLTGFASGLDAKRFLLQHEAQVSGLQLKLD